MKANGFLICLFFAVVHARITHLQCLRDAAGLTLNFDGGDAVPNDIVVLRHIGQAAIAGDAEVTGLLEGLKMNTQRNYINECNVCRLALVNSTCQIVRTQHNKR